MEKRAMIEGRDDPPASGVPIPDPAQVAGIFNAELQYVSNAGAHAFVAPGEGDQRGPCPGLNAMANHNYIPHNGIATIEQFMNGTYEVFGMGVDLGALLAVYGAVQDGDLTSWSIGGPPAVLGLGGNGLIGSHNKYESDVSPTRPDLYEYGNNYEVEMSQWEALYAKQSSLPNDQSNYNLAVLQEFRVERFNQSISNNPYFFNAPFTGIGVQPAAYTFIYRFMANKSAEHPDGVLTQDVIKSFFGITENPDGSFSGGLGQERIPDNWYKRAIGDEYTIPFFILDLNYEALQHPQFLDIGGNTGTTNSFVGVDVTDLTSGVYNSETLLQGNNLFCLGYQTAQEGLMDQLEALGGTLTQLIGQISPQAATAITNLGCPVSFG
ncbi:MAG: hypothetical protein LQ340_001735 [Diploschistes diacapsis]|nr:MAG: hypothetical protein LQ340_001735 [Diploschistes diacapsis]